MSSPACRDIDQLLIPFKAFKEHFGSNATGVLTAIVAPRLDGTAPVIRVSIHAELSDVAALCLGFWFACSVVGRVR